MRRKRPTGSRGFFTLEVVSGPMAGALYFCPSVDVARRAALELQSAYGCEWLVWQYDEFGVPCIVAASPGALPF